MLFWNERGESTFEYPKNETLVSRLHGDGVSWGGRGAEMIGDSLERTANLALPCEQTGREGNLEDR